jgi:peptidoglycan/LPS O-acetylase OafA/YrhL
MAVKRQIPVLPAVILALFLAVLVFLLVIRKSQAAVNNKDTAMFSPSNVYFEACQSAKPLVTGLPHIWAIAATLFRLPNSSVE